MARICCLHLQKFRFVFRCLAAALLLLVCYSTAFATENTLAPNGRVIFTFPFFTDTSAVSFMGEAGARNFRGSGTYGAFFSPCQRFKISAEYLRQHLKYHFFSEHKRKWVSQYATGFDYEYILPRSLFQSIELGGAYSHAFHHHIGSTTVTSPGGIIKKLRRIAGSDAGFGHLGTTVDLWKCAFLSAYANYDYVKYHRHFEHHHMATGWGGSASFVQQFAENYALTLDAEFRKPFHFYQATLDWNPIFTNWEFNVGVYGNYTDGRRGLPDVFAAGLQLGFAIGPKTRNCCRAQPKDTPAQDCYIRQYCDISEWVSTPAVYMPVVLAVADKKIESICNAPVTSEPILPNPMVITDFHNFPIPTAPFFQSPGPLTFSASGLPPQAIIDPATGVITILALFQGSPNVTVTATSSCSSSSQSFVLMPGG
jgi:hypothetical protein